MIRSSFLVALLSLWLNATSSLTGIELYLDNENKGNIACVDGIHCTLSSSALKTDNHYNMQRVFDSYMGFTRYKNTPKDTIVLELGHWGYAEHRFFKYEPNYKDLFLTKVEYYYNTMNMDGGETEVKVCQIIRSNLDASKVLISDKKILAVLSQFLGKKLKDEVVFDTQKEYLLTQHNVEAYNNLAYYLNKEGVAGAVQMLLAIVKAFPKRAVTYYTLADFYEKKAEMIKMRDAYIRYVWLMTKEAKSHKIPKKVKEYLNGLYSVVTKVAKEYESLTFLQWGDINKDEVNDLAFFVESESGKTKLMVYLYDAKQEKYRLVGSNSKLLGTYEHLPASKENESDEEMMEDFYFLSSMTFDKILTLKFSQGNYHTIFRGVDNRYKFQYRDNKMKLIGAELFNYGRGTGQGGGESINYLSGKVERYEVEELDKRVGTSKWSKLKKSKLIALEDFLYEDAY